MTAISASSTPVCSPASAPPSTARWLDTPKHACFSPAFWLRDHEKRRETHVSAASQAQAPHPRISRAYEVGHWSPGAQQPAPEGPTPPRGQRLQEVSGAAVPAENFPRADRILSRKDFLRVQRDGTRVHTPHFVIMVLPDGRRRLGITVTRKAAGAVGRNRVRRLVREVFRRNRELFPQQSELVLVARTGADRLDYTRVLSEIAKAQGALQRAAILGRTRPEPSEAAP